jgi:pimeloyl-ACP methyl ester carboxylesterase
MMNRRTLIGVAAAVAAFPMLNRIASAQTSLKTKNVVFVHGLFADGSCWSKVIARLQQKGINCTSVQNSLTSLHEASEAARRAIAAQSGPTVLVGHSFSGMIVSEVGLDPKITALVYVAARAPDAGEDYTALAKNYPTPPATAGIVFNDDWGQLSEEAFLRDFAGDLPPEEARLLYAVQQPFKKSLTTEQTTNAAWRIKPSFYAVSTQDRTINRSPRPGAAADQAPEPQGLLVPPLPLCAISAPARTAGTGPGGRSGAAPNRRPPAPSYRVGGNRRAFVKTAADLPGRPRPPGLRTNIA